MGEQTLLARGLSVLASAAIAAAGLWAGLGLAGLAGRVGVATALAAVVTLLVAEAAARPVLRGLARRGGAIGALVVGVVGQLVIAAAVLLVVAGVRIQRWYDLVIVIVLGTMALVTAVGRWLVGASDAAYVVGHALRRSRAATTAAPRRGLVVVQFDGVSAEVLRRAVAAGQMPTIARWLREGSHVLRDWWVPVPSTTPASHAALLHGDEAQVPGFRWWDRELDKLMVSNRPADAAVVEARLRAGCGLLRDGGVAISTSFSGEAAESFLVFSRAGTLEGLGRGSSFVPLFASPFLLPRALLLTLGGMVKELYQARRQRVRGVEPRIRRRLSYVALRGLTNVFLRTLNLVLVCDAMSRSAPVIFVDLVDYDEIVHHAGPERPEAMRALEGLDAVLGELARAAQQVPTDYEFVLWSDHGQSLGPTFEQVSGVTLAERVQELLADDAVATLESAGGDDWGPLNALLATTFSRSGSRGIGPDRGRATTEAALERPDVVVVGGGNLGMAWFPDWTTRPTLRQLDARWPGLVPGLALTTGIGAVLVADDDGGTVVVGAEGVHHLDSGAVQGIDPLNPTGRAPRVTCAG